MPSDRAVVDIGTSRSPNAKSLLGNDVGDAYISDSLKVGLENIWNAKGFSIQLPCDENDVSFIRKLDESWWNDKVKL